MNTNIKPKIPIALYARKSTYKDNSISVELQINIMKEYFLNCYGDTCEFFEFKDDGYTGKNDNRPDFQKMLSLAKQNSFNIVAVYKIDRCARNRYEFVALSKSLQDFGVKLVSTSEFCDSSTKQGKMMMDFLSIFAEWESNQISERVSNSLETLAKIGCFSGGTAPIGYISTRLPYKSQTYSKKLCYLEVNPDQKKVVQDIFSLAAAGYSTYEISKNLNFHPKTISNIISNPTYVPSDQESSDYLKSIGYEIYGDLNGYGFLPYNRRCKENGKRESNSKKKFVACSLHEAIISSDIWILANENIKNRRKEKHNRISTKSFLSHLPKCVCGSGMFVDSRSSKLYFRCSNCKSKWLRGDYVETKILTFLKDLPLDKLLLNQYCNNINSPKIPLKSQIKNKKKEISEIEKSIYNLRLNLRFINGSAVKLISNDINELCDKKILLEDELTKLELEASQSKNKLNNNILNSHIKWLINNFQSLDVDDKHRFAQSIISEIKYNGIDEVTIIFK